MGISNSYSGIKFYIPDTRAIIGFISNNIIIVVSSEGKYYLAEFDDKKQNFDCLKLDERNLDISSLCYV